ncbi:DUF2062 domain-containing protein [Arenicella xantha]|uniref:DUF2062 domain-containing protein n=1 Tax=Arenicella xantha TaxID=644221 RepID=A0A395JJ75_9GAMM|nr:DUF2062 domain-containing protein [Arenicella xantha]RBP50836.1 hypothetical protein DFR28_102252 [Arenicella xantha]
MKIFTYLRKYLPTVKDIQQYRYLHIFGDSLKQQELWSFNRQSTAKGVAIGLFCAFLPMPFEMVPAIFLAALMRGNLPFAVAGIWISNPLTWIPLYTPCYLLGAMIIGVEPVALHQITIFQLGWHYVALWLGCLIVGIVISVSVHFIISAAWRSQVRQRWKRRKQIRLTRGKTDTPAK